MDKKKQNWGSVRSKLTQEGYMYRMKLGNPTSSGSNQPLQRRPSSSASASAKSRLSPDAGRGTRVPTAASDTDGRVIGAQGISELLDKLNLGHSTQKEEGLDPNTAIGFLFRCYTPFVIQRYRKTIDLDPGEFLDTTIFDDNLVAKALVVWASDMRDLFGPDPGTAGELLLAQRSSVLRELRKRISSAEACTSDSVMWTILMLAGAELIHDNMQAMGTHLGALRHIINLRGGIDSPSLNKWVKIFLLQFERFLNYRQFVHVRSASIESMSPVVERPSYQFPPNFRERLTNLPPGFAELFNTASVHVQLLKMVEHINQWKHQLPDVTQGGRERAASPSVGNAMTLDSFRAFDLLQQKDLAATERLLLLGMFSFCIYMNDQVYSVMEWALRLHCVGLVHKHMDPIGKDARDGMIWVAAMLAATGGDNSPAWQLGERIHRASRGVHAGLHAIIPICQRYFWHPDLTERLTAATGDSNGDLFGDAV